MKKLLFVGMLVSMSANAATLSLKVLDSDGEPVANAVVIVNNKDPNHLATGSAKKAVMKQEDKQFAPHVLSVSVGTQVSFPNADSVKHHVYSFSDAKTFELELYDEFDGSPITFDKPGIVDLGCNIHDWMLGYIYVTDAHYHVTTSETGMVDVEVANGDYTLSLWHPRAQQADIDNSLEVSLNDKHAVSLSFSLQFTELLDFSDGFDDY